MPLTLDPQTEQRIQQEVEAGHYRNPAELINRALDSMHAEDQNAHEERNAIRADLEESWHELQRGEFISGEIIEQMVAERRTKRVS